MLYWRELITMTNSLLKQLKTANIIIRYRNFYKLLKMLVPSLFIRYESLESPTLNPLLSYSTHIFGILFAKNLSQRNSCCQLERINSLMKT